MANSEDVQRDEERRTLIRLALGKASVAFMRQSAEVVMPTEELLEVAEDIHAVWALEVDNLAAEVRELRKDKAMLDKLWRNCGGTGEEDGSWVAFFQFKACPSDPDGWPDDIREAIDLIDDAAMGGEG